MRATVLDLRRRMKDVLRALDRNESVTILHRGKVKGIIHPSGEKRSRYKSVKDHPACGIWKDREDMKDPAAWVRKMREGRVHGV